MEENIRNPQITQISQIKTNQKRKTSPADLRGNLGSEICGRSSSSDFDIERSALFWCSTLATRHLSLFLHLVPDRPQVVEDRLEQ